MTADRGRISLYAYQLLSQTRFLIFISFLCSTSPPPPLIFFPFSFLFHPCVTVFCPAPFPLTQVSHSPNPLCRPCILLLLFFFFSSYLIISILSNKVQLFFSVTGVCFNLTDIIPLLLMQHRIIYVSLTYFAPLLFRYSFSYYLLGTASMRKASVV